MSGNLKGFDAQNVEPTSFDVLPAGEYEVAIVDSEVRATKDGSGKYLNLEIEVIDGQFSGRKIFDRLNLWNQSPKAVEIAKASLSAICRSVNVLTPNDSSDLHGKQLRVKVGVRKSDEYGDQNEVKAYKKSNGQVVGDLPPRGQAPPEDEIPF